MSYIYLYFKLLVLVVRRLPIKLLQFITAQWINIYSNRPYELHSIAEKPHIYRYIECFQHGTCSMTQKEGMLKCA
jgi:hypothetical protein